MHPVTHVGKSVHVTNFHPQVCQVIASKRQVLLRHKSQVAAVQAPAMLLLWCCVGAWV